MSIGRLIWHVGLRVDFFARRFNGFCRFTQISLSTRMLRITRNYTDFLEVFYV